MINSVMYYVQSIAILDEKFEKTVMIPKGCTSYTNFVLESIYDTYKITKECPMVNLLVILKKQRPEYLSDRNIKSTQFYSKHLKFFENHFPMIAPPAYNVSFTPGGYTSTTGTPTWTNGLFISNISFP